MAARSPNGMLIIPAMPTIKKVPKIALPKPPTPGGSKAPGGKLVKRAKESRFPPRYKSITSTEKSGTQAMTAQKTVMLLKMMDLSALRSKGCFCSPLSLDRRDLSSAYCLALLVLTMNQTGYSSSQPDPQSVHDVPDGDHLHHGGVREGEALDGRGGALELLRAAEPEVTTWSTPCSAPTRRWAANRMSLAKKERIASVRNKRKSRH